MRNGAWEVLTEERIAQLLHEVAREERENRRRRRRERVIGYRLRSLVLERDGFRCRRCGAGPDDERLVVDHVMPVALGGTSTMENLQTLCEPCNLGKGDRLPHAHDRRGLA